MTITKDGDKDSFIIHATADELGDLSYACDCAVLNAKTLVVQSKQTGKKANPYWQRLYDSCMAIGGVITTAYMAD